jgi:hypothetical protein
LLSFGALNPSNHERRARGSAGRGGNGENDEAAVGLPGVVIYCGDVGLTPESRLLWDGVVFGRRNGPWVGAALVCFGGEVRGKRRWDSSCSDLFRVFGSFEAAGKVRQQG